MKGSVQGDLRVWEGLIWGDREGVFPSRRGCHKERKKMRSGLLLLLFSSPNYCCFYLDQEIVAAFRYHHEQERLLGGINARRFESRETTVWTHQRNHLDNNPSIHASLKTYWLRDKKFDHFPSTNTPSFPSTIGEVKVATHHQIVW